MFPFYGKIVFQPYSSVVGLMRPMTYRFVRIPFAGKTMVLRGFVPISVRETAAQDAAAFARSDAHGELYSCSVFDLEETWS